MLSKAQRKTLRLLADNAAHLVEQIGVGCTIEPGGKVVYISTLAVLQRLGFVEMLPVGEVEKVRLELDKDETALWAECGFHVESRQCEALYAAAHRLRALERLKDGVYWRLTEGGRKAAREE